MRSVGVMPMGGGRFVVEAGAELPVSWWGWSDWWLS